MGAGDQAEAEVRRADRQLKRERPATPADSQPNKHIKKEPTVAAGAASAAMTGAATAVTSTAPPAGSAYGNTRVPAAAAGPSSAAAARGSQGILAGQAQPVGAAAMPLQNGTGNQQRYQQLQQHAAEQHQQLQQQQAAPQPLTHVGCRVMSIWPVHCIALS